ncbi:hypothetical protein VTO73DRAFT_13123 [Trametes versicolor]
MYDPAKAIAVVQGYFPDYTPQTFDNFVSTAAADSANVVILSKHISCLEDRIRERDDCIKEREDHIKEQEDRISSLQSELAEKREDFEKLRSTVKTYHDEMSTLRANQEDIATLDERIDALVIRVKERDEQNAILNSRSQRIVQPI